MLDVSTNKGQSKACILENLVGYLTHREGFTLSEDFNNPAGSSIKKFEFAEELFDSFKV